MRNNNNNNGFRRNGRFRGWSDREILEYVTSIVLEERERNQAEREKNERRWEVLKPIMRKINKFNGIVANKLDIDYDAI